MGDPAKKINEEHLGGVRGKNEGRVPALVAGIDTSTGGNAKQNKVSYQSEDYPQKGGGGRRRNNKKTTYRLTAIIRLPKEIRNSRMRPKGSTANLKLKQKGDCGRKGNYSKAKSKRNER